MRDVRYEEYEELKVFFKKEMTKLAKHENKNLFLGQTAINNCFVWNLGNDSELFLMPSPGFIRIIEDEYIKALKDNPECFGTGDAKDVIHALYIQAQKNNWVWDEKRYAEYLSNEKFCLLVYKYGKQFNDDLLRIDLYRKLDESKEKTGSWDFTGGLFHSLKHFSVNEQCASIMPNQNVTLYDILQLIFPIAKAFFEGNWKKGKRPKTFETCTNYLNKQFTLEFFKEDESVVSFVNSIIPKSI